jgi:hypothetical protein
VCDDFLIIGRGSREGFPMKAFSRNAMVVHLRVWKFDCGVALKMELFIPRLHPCRRGAAELANRVFHHE